MNQAEYQEIQDFERFVVISIVILVMMLFTYVGI